MLYKLFSLCFSSGLSPLDWSFSDIKPIPKKDKDSRDPLNNRCITIMCCISKIYSTILNHRLQKFFEENKLLVDEQNGFRAARSCMDHIFVLFAILNKFYSVERMRRHLYSFNSCVLYTWVSLEALNNLYELPIYKPNSPSL